MLLSSHQSFCQPCSHVARSASAAARCLSFSWSVGGGVGALGITPAAVAFGTLLRRHFVAHLLGLLAMFCLQLGTCLSHPFFVGGVCPELAQALLRVALASHTARSSTPEDLRVNAACPSAQPELACASCVSCGSAPLGADSPRWSCQPGGGLVARDRCRLLSCATEWWPCRQDITVFTS